MKGLEAKPQTEGHWAQVGTGVTWGQRWHGTGWDERRTMLRDAGIEFRVKGGPGKDREVSIPKRFDRTAVVRQQFSV